MINRWVDKYIRKKTVEERKSVYENGGVTELVRITGDKTDTSQINDFAPERTEIPESQKVNNSLECVRITESRQNTSLQRKKLAPKRVKLTDGQKNIPSGRKDSEPGGPRNISPPTKNSASEHIKNRGYNNISSPIIDSAPERVRIIEDKKVTYSPAKDSGPGHVKNFEGQKKTTKTKASQTHLSSDLQPSARRVEKNIRGILIKRTSTETKRPSAGKKVRFVIQEDQFEDSVSKFLRSREDKGSRARKSSYRIPVDEAWPLYQNSTRSGSPIETRIQPTNISERPGTNNNAEMDIDDAIADIIRNMDE